MKKIYFILIVFISGTVIKAQGNLQFNQILTYSGQLGGTVNPGDFYFESPNWSVPQGKVWKIERKTRTGYSGLTFLVNNVPDADLYVIERTNSNAVSMVVDNSPTWLKAADQIKFRFTGRCHNCNGNCPCTVFVDYFISIIEFNLTQ